MVEAGLGAGLKTDLAAAAGRIHLVVAAVAAVAAHAERQILLVAEAARHIGGLGCSSSAVARGLNSSKPNLG